MAVFVFDEMKVSKEDWEIFQTVTQDSTRINDVEDALIELAEIIGGGE